MKNNRAFLAIILTVILTLSKAIVQEKSFILKNTTPSVFCIALYQNSLLLTSFYDIVQKDIETGKTQRTLRGHENIIFSFVVTSDSKLISSAIDDSVVLWDLLTGSVLQRIKLQQKQTIISTISVQDDQVFTGGFDSLVRQIDLTEGRVVKTFAFGDIITSIVVKGDFIYVATAQQGNSIQKRRISTSETSLFFTGHTDTVSCLVLREETLFSGSNDKTIIFWNVVNGQSIRILVGHAGSVTALTILGKDLYSGSNDGMVIKWDIASGDKLIDFPRRHTNVVKSLACNQNSLFSGSDDKSVIRWNKLNGSPEYFYLSQEIRIRSMFLWKNFIIGGRDDSDIQLVDASILKLEPIALMKGHISSLGYYNQTMELDDFDRHTGAVRTLSVDNLYLFSGGDDLIVRQWTKSTWFITEFIGHVGQVNNLQLENINLFSGSQDKDVRKDLLQATNIVNVIHLLQNSFIVGTNIGLQSFSKTNGESLIVYAELTSCTSLAATDLVLFSGHDNNLIYTREFNLLFALTTYLSHNDVITSLHMDSTGVLYSASLDGQILKWDTKLRKVAFSFEDRSRAVTSLAAVQNYLVVGLQSGYINIFNIEDTILIDTVWLHNKSVDSLAAVGDQVFSCSSDGNLKSFNPFERFNQEVVSDHGKIPIRGLIQHDNNLLYIKGDYDIIISSSNASSHVLRTISSSYPVFCITSTTDKLFAASLSGEIFAWDLKSGRFEFSLVGHLAVVNSLLVADGSLFSASDDKSIIQWSLERRDIVRTYKRYSAAALGHTGPVNAITFCSGLLLSVGKDDTLRVWNIDTGNQVDQFRYFKSATAVICHNNISYAGSEDFSVLMFDLEKINVQSGPETSRIKTISTKKRKRSKNVRATRESEDLSQRWIVLIIASSSVLVILITGFVFYVWRSKIASKSASPTVSSTADSTFTEMDLQTVVNSVMGISKHAEYIIDNSVVAKVKKIATGGGGDLFLCKVMDPRLVKTTGDFVVQKLVFVNNKLKEEAFYQEVGIMVMLSSFPHFCKILGYTEKPLSIIMRYYLEGSLFDWIRNRSLSRSIAIQILLEVSRALKVMHSNYLAHCDLKSQNILVEIVNGIPAFRLTDFGITEILSDRIIASKAFRVVNLRGLSILYSSPEAFVCYKTKHYVGVDFKKFDVYSLACLSYEVLTQKSPWN
ncbi:hypothetical protein MP638_003508 [Amoeboaphelidium occidentale]|nr:hypothetical protein MP638_003508 [Amoeboaphelidium occidentale]